MQCVCPLSVCESVGDLEVMGDPKVRRLCERGAGLKLGLEKEDI